MIRPLREVIRELLITYEPSRDELEETIFREVIGRHIYNTRAAAAFGVTRQTIAARVRKYKIDVQKLRAEKRSQLTIKSVKKLS